MSLIAVDSVCVHDLGFQQKKAKHLDNTRINYDYCCFMSGFPRKGNIQKTVMIYDCDMMMFLPPLQWQLMPSNTVSIWYLPHSHFLYPPAGCWP